MSCGTRMHFTQARPPMSCIPLVVNFGPNPLSLPDNIVCWTVSSLSANVSQVYTYIEGRNGLLHKILKRQEHDYLGATCSSNRKTFVYSWGIQPYCTAICTHWAVYKLCFWISCPIPDLPVATSFSMAELVLYYLSWMTLCFPNVCLINLLSKSASQSKCSISLQALVSPNWLWWSFHQCTTIGCALLRGAFTVCLWLINSR